VFLDFFVVPNVFSFCSQYVHQVFNVFPNMFPIATHFVPYALPKVLLLKLHNQRRRLFRSMSILGVFKA
jgi:hypothetical protein